MDSALSLPTHAPAQVLRLTAMLRATEERGLNISAMSLQRKEALEAKRRQQGEKKVCRALACST